MTKAVKSMSFLLLIYSIYFHKICIKSVPPRAANNLKLTGESHLLHVIIFLTAKLTILSLTRGLRAHKSHSLCISVFLFLFIPLPLFSPFATPACDSSEELNPADVSPLI